MIRKYPHTVANQSELLEAGEKLVEYLDIRHDNRVALTPPAVQRLVAVYKRHLALMAPVGLFVPKHHLMLHFTHRTSVRHLARRGAQPRFEARAEELPPTLFRGACFHAAWKRARPIQAPPAQVSDPCPF